MRRFQPKIYLFFLAFLLWGNLRAVKILIPMDKNQTDHLRAYGIAYWALEQGLPVDWLLNYRAGSFLMDYDPTIESKCLVRNVSTEILSSAQLHAILNEISMPTSNMDIMKLEKKPKVAIYSPKSKQPWDDAVTLVLTYAGIPYQVIFDDEIMYGELIKYDWLHLHHEDFTGQYGKFYRNYGHMIWYQRQQHEYESSALAHGFSKVSQLKLEIAKKIQAYVASGGFLFAMCSAADTIDIALAAQGLDICDTPFDADPYDPASQQALNFDNTFAFQDFTLEYNPYVYEFSDIDTQPHQRGLQEENDYFTIFEFSAKWDPIPTMLTQNHEFLIKGFMGQTTSFKKKLVKANVLTMGEPSSIDEVRYIHGVLGKGFFTFYGGHDPEDYQHVVGEEPTDLNLHPNSPGYRLILNNVLFPSAKKKKRKT